MVILFEVYETSLASFNKCILNDHLLYIYSKIISFLTFLLSALSSAYVLGSLIRVNSVCFQDKI